MKFSICNNLNRKTFIYLCLIYIAGEETSKNSEKEREPEVEAVDKMDGSFIVKDRTTENNGDVNLIASW